MIFPNCERLGQTIIFVRSREGARTLHTEMEKDGYKCTSIQVRCEPCRGACQPARPHAAARRALTALSAGLSPGVGAARL